MLIGMLYIPNIFAKNRSTQVLKDAADTELAVILRRLLFQSDAAACWGIILDGISFPSGYSRIAKGLDGAVCLKDYGLMRRVAQSRYAIRN
jgi:hypothetical protein